MQPVAAWQETLPGMRTDARFIQTAEGSWLLRRSRILRPRGHASRIAPASMTRSSGRSETATVVAVVNTNPDLVRLLRVALEAAGFVVLIIHIEDMKLGSTDVDMLLNQHDPRVIVYDVAPPYEQNWRFLDHLRTHTAFRGRQFVLTSVNVKRMRDIVGKDESVYEVAGQRTDIEQVVRATKEASRSRPTR